MKGTLIVLAVRIILWCHDRARRRHRPERRRVQHSQGKSGTQWNPQNPVSFHHTGARAQGRRRRAGHRLFSLPAGVARCRTSPRTGSDPIRRMDFPGGMEPGQTKRGYEWLFPAIDLDKDGQIPSAEYKEFQAFKQTNLDWEKQVRGRIGGSFL